MPYPSVDRAVNLSALHRATTKERNLSGIIIFIRICDSSRAADIYFVAASLRDTYSASPGSTVFFFFGSFSLFHPLSLSFSFLSGHVESRKEEETRGRERRRARARTRVDLLNVGSFDDLTPRRIINNYLRAICHLEIFARAS